MFCRSEVDQAYFEYGVNLPNYSKENVIFTVYIYTDSENEIGRKMKVGHSVSSETVALELAGIQ